MTIFLIMNIFGKSFHWSRKVLNANPLTTPVYFNQNDTSNEFMQSAILRYIPNILVGVVVPALASINLFILPITDQETKAKIFSNYPINIPNSCKNMTCVNTNWWTTSWIPYIKIGKIATVVYFLCYLSNPLLIKPCDKLIKSDFKLTWTKSHHTFFEATLAP